MIRKSNLLLIAFCFLSRLSFAQQFDKQSVLSDLAFLYQSLEASHYNLYAYVDRESFKHNYLEVKSSIQKDSIGLLQVTSIFQRVISKANTGHAEISFPVASYRSYGMNGGTLFPIEVTMVEGKALVSKNFSKNRLIELGDELLMINDEPIKAIFDKIYPQLSAETPYFKQAKLELYSLPRLYWQVFGRQDSFRVKFKELGEVTLTAVNLIDDFEMKRSEMITPDRQLKFYEQSVYLKPGNFSGDEKEYKHFIDSVFTKIKDKKAEHLILDLRNNSGGHNEFSDYLVAYFADQPFKWNAKFTLKTSAILKEQTRLNNDTTDVYFKKILEYENGETYEYFHDTYQPRDKSEQFTGKVYVLVNRHSYSMAAVTAAMIQDYDFGVIVGEETGDFPTLHASQFSYSLPKTGISVKVPKGYMIRPNKNEQRRGVVPDIKMNSDVTSSADNMLEQLLQKITT